MYIFYSFWMLNISMSVYLLPRWTWPSSSWSSQWRCRAGWSTVSWTCCTAPASLLASAYQSGKKQISRLIFSRILRQVKDLYPALLLETLSNLNRKNFLPLTLGLNVPILTLYMLMSIILFSVGWMLLLGLGLGACLSVGFLQELVLAWGKC